MFAGKVRDARHGDDSAVSFPTQAIFKLIPKDEVARLPSDENTAEKRADKLWKFFDKGENGESRSGRLSWRARTPLIGVLCFFLPQSESRKVSLSKECWTMKRPCV